MSLEGLMAEFSQSGTEFEVEHNCFDEEIAFLVWHADTPDNQYEFATDTMVIRDGKIRKQFLGAKEPVQEFGWPIQSHTRMTLSLPTIDKNKDP